MGSSDILIVGGIALLAGAWLFYPDLFAGFQIPGASAGGGEFIDGSVTPGGDFIVEDTANPTGDCKSKYNGKCKGECASDKYSARCQDCIAVCGGGQGQPPGQCFSVGKDKSVKCGSTSNTCTGSVGKLTCKCGSNVPGNHVKNDRPFNMGGNRTCTDCVNYCKTGTAPKVLNGSTPGTVSVVAPGRVYPIKLTTNCTQVSASRYRWISGGKSAEDNGSCNNARNAWLKRYTPNTGQQQGAKKCNKSDTCPVIAGGYKRCTCGCAGGSWTIGANTPCSQCETACRARRRQAGYSDAAFYFEDAAEQYMDNGLRFSNMAMAV
jgi:hypothetical protein